MKKKLKSLICRLPGVRTLIQKLKKIEIATEKNQKAIKKLAGKNDNAHKQIKKQNAKTKSEIAEVKSQINILKQEVNRSAQEINRLKQELNTSNEKINSLMKEKDFLKQNHTDLKKKLETQNQAMSRLKGELKKEILYRYYKGLHPDQYEENLKEWFSEHMDTTLHLDHPKTYNEKIQWMKLFDSTPEKTRLADKYLVRDYVAEKIGKQYLIPLIGVWRRVEDIDFDALPDKYVLKTNHGCTWNIIVPDKTQLDVEDAKRKLKTWLHTNFAFCNGLEMQYANIQPCIIAEEYMENSIGGLNDYKVFCFNGKAKYIMFLTERSTKLKMAFYDLDWNLMPFVYDHERVDREVERPDNLEEMVSLAEKLSEGFAHVRVDFYRLDDGRLFFGELTFTSASGACRWNPPEYNDILGDMIDLEKVTPYAFRLNQRTDSQFQR